MEEETKTWIKFGIIVFLLVVTIFVSLGNKQECNCPNEEYFEPWFRMFEENIFNNEQFRINNELLNLIHTDTNYLKYGQDDILGSINNKCQ